MEGKQNNRRPRLMSDIQRPVVKPRVLTEPVKRVEQVKPVEPTIPVDEEEDLDNIPLRAILGAWSRQAVRGTPLEKHLKHVHRKGKHLVKLKNQATNDLKWALMADLDEPVRPRTKQPKPAPTVSLPRAATLRTSKFLGRMNRKYWIAVIALIFIVILIFLIPKPAPAPHKSNDTKSASSAQSSPPAIPEAPALFPQGKTAASVQNYQKLRNSYGQLTYSYRDMLQGASVSVTEVQVAKDELATVNAKVAKTAEGYAAVEKVTAGSTPVYISSPANGTQSVIFAKGGWIVTIGSSKNLGNNNWKTYVNGMQ